MAAGALPEGLLDDVKQGLGITWDETDGQISEYVQQGIFYLDNKCNSAQDYTKQGYPRKLLFNFVRYARDYVLEVFENNFQSDILAMQSEVIADVQDTEDDE